jgi:hypothetical protein
MLFLGAYDFNHAIFVSHTQPFQFKIIKNKSITFENPQMIETFLNAYELPQETLQRFTSATDIQNHILDIQKKYACHEEWILLSGLQYLFECKQTPKNPFKSYYDSLLSEFEQLLTNLEDEIAAGVENPSLPVLEITKRLFQKLYYQAHIKDSLQNTLIVLSQQGFLSVCQLIEAVLELNIPAKNLILMTKPHTTSLSNLEAFEALSEEHGFTYISQSRQYHEAGPNADYHLFKKRSVVETTHQVHSLLAEGEYQNLIVHDEGGELISQLDFDRLNDQEIKISTSEHTTCGLAQRQSLQPLEERPCFNMAGSGLKAKLEAYFIAEASLAKLEILLSRKMAESPHKIKVVVIGAGGNIGFYFLKLLKDKYQNTIDIIISEKDEAKYQNLIQYQDFAELARVEAPAAFQEANIIFGCTGQDITQNIALTSIPPEHELTLISLSSGTREFSSWMPDLSSTRYPFITLLNHGKPIIFDGECHGIHPLKIQIIRALAMASVVVQLMYLSIEPKLKQSTQAINHQIHEDFHQKRDIFKTIDAQLQQFIFNMYLKMCLRLNKTAQFNNFFKCEFFPNVEAAIQKDYLQPVIKMKHQWIEYFNAFARIDKNHQIHLLNISGQFELYISKNKRKIYDHEMVKAILAKYTINYLEFTRMSDYLKLEIIAKTFKNFQLNLFFLENKTERNQPAYPR